ncbi:TIGR01777 family oxidoreductase [Sunxiuqinia elliptica]|uniref:TIGR01777 family protein n=1 Tax=Sunxiuqinia elliptica TaxID=655355 RepID=A0A1I2K283_9BACT|nr:TIGR01777 family oxidoreductase [Sunxiuqinia elliptica]SFF60290.1 hypothetical protein SAMN05216283_110105 [Sunxiuqinia elliptica]
MKVGLTGANGYIGQNINHALRLMGVEVIAIDRHLLYGHHLKLAKELANTHTIINLAGAPILKRWTKKNKTIIYNSRVSTTRNLCKAINALPREKRPTNFISASAIGIYRPAIRHDETSSKYANHFAARVIDDWEDTLAELPDTVRKTIFRIGVVLGKDSQFIQQVLPVFKLGLGGKLGSGSQAFPFIHIDDLVSAFTQAITDDSFFGIYNLVAPQQINNKDLTKALGKQLNRPTLIPVPGFLLHFIFGQASTLILENPVVIPRRLKNKGFNFQHPTIENCLENILSNN